MATESSTRPTTSFGARALVIRHLSSPTETATIKSITTTILSGARTLGKRGKTWQPGPAAALVIRRSPNQAQRRYLRSQLCAHSPAGAEVGKQPNSQTSPLLRFNLCAQNSQRSVVRLWLLLSFCSPPVLPTRCSPLPKEKT